MRWIASLAFVCTVGCDRTPVESPLEGPGFDPVTGEFVGTADQYLVGITHLQVRNAPGPGGQFGELADEIGNYLFEEEPTGWMGAGFRNVGRLRWWTLTVWDSEEAMVAFIVSDPHAKAMVVVDDVSAGAVSRSLWMDAAELPLAWDDALDLLAETQDATYGDPDWP